MHPLIARLLDVAVRHARLDPAAFGAFCFRDQDGQPWDVQPFHREWQSLITRHDRLVLMAPVEHGKTEQVLTARLLWELGRDPSLRAAVVCNTYIQAQKIGYALRQHIESNPRLHRVFPGLRPGQRWTSGAFDVRGKPTGKDYSVQCLGAFGSILGARLDIIIIDDICDYENTRTALQRRKLHEWVASTLLGRLTERGRVIVIGTAWHEEDLLHRLEARGAPWVVRRYRAIRQDGTPLWPERWPTERLEAKRKELGSFEFCRQFLNEVYDESTALFKPWWIRIADADEIPPRSEMVAVVRFWDLAATEPKDGTDPDWTVGALVGMDREGRYWVLDVRRLRGTPRDVELAVRQCAEIDGPGVRVVIEQEPGAAGKSLLEHYQRHVLAGWAVYPKRQTGSKYARAQPLAAAAEAGRVYLRRAAWNGDLLDELSMFPRGAHDDQVDALAGALEAVRRGEGRIEMRVHGILAR